MSIKIRPQDLFDVNFVICVLSAVFIVIRMLTINKTINVDEKKIYILFLRGRDDKDLEDHKLEYKQKNRGKKHTEKIFWKDHV